LFLFSSVAFLFVFEREEPLWLAEQQLEVELDLVVVEEEVEVEEAWLSEEGVSEVIDASSSSWLVELVSWLEALAEALVVDHRLARILVLNWTSQS
jgi:aminoglycoside phosphotransferase